MRALGYYEDPMETANNAANAQAKANTINELNWRELRLARWAVYTTVGIGLAAVVGMMYWGRRAFHHRRTT